MGFLQRHMQGHVVVELERDDLAQALRRVELGQAAVERDPMLEVHDEVALDELGEVEELVDLGALGGYARIEDRPALALAAEDLGLRDNDQAGGVLGNRGPIQHRQGEVSRRRRAYGGHAG